jgi:3D (Asp-Asp-Asp) domain-containing protein
VATTQEWTAGAQRRRWTRGVAQGVVALSLCAVTAGSAVIVKEFRSSVHPLAAVDVVPIDATVSASPVIATETAQAENSAASILATPEATAAETSDEPETEALPSIAPELMKYASDPAVRWFNGRPIHPSQQMWMTVTAYSPDERSCGASADGHTATLHSVSTNNMKLVAADTRILPFGSVISIPGYNDGKVVPVLDRGGAIKGRHLDLLFPTDAEARQWGKKKLLVTVWEYADGKPADNPRQLR